MSRGWLFELLRSIAGDSIPCGCRDHSETEIDIVKFCIAVEYVVWKQWQRRVSRIQEWGVQGMSLWERYQLYSDIRQSNHQLPNRGWLVDPWRNHRRMAASQIDIYLWERCIFYDWRLNHVQKQCNLGL